MSQDITIREFQRRDREDVRRISLETAFLEKNQGNIFDNPEILADALTMYFTDYEPLSCFVAEDNGKVVGYIIGSADAASMRRVMHRHIIPDILWKFFIDLTFLRKTNFVFLIQLLKSLFKGEFLTPEFGEKYPATLHINIDKLYRGRHLGAGLMQRYLEYLKSNNVPGVYLATYSEKAKMFFQKMGFQIIFSSQRSCLKHYAGHDVSVYVFGKTL